MGDMPTGNPELCRASGYEQGPSIDKMLADLKYARRKLFESMYMAEFVNTEELIAKWSVIVTTLCSEIDNKTGRRMSKLTSRINKPTN